MTREQEEVTVYAPAIGDEGAQMASETPTTVDPVVTSSWLSDHTQDLGVVLVDSRWYLDGRSGYEAYRNGHIPHAVFVDLDNDLSAPASPADGRHPLPEPGDFAAAMRRLGISADSTVVIYDDAGGTIAARLWWMLDVAGVDARVLDGGIDSWDGELERGDHTNPGGRLEFARWPRRRVAAIEEVAALSTGGATRIFDARSAERYAQGADIDPRPGHIPGAWSAPAADNLNADGTWRTTDDLLSHYRLLGAENHPVVAYCGSGVTACADLLGMRRAGLADGWLYPGSWSQWGNDSERPAVEGPEPT
jgi:thiosulfate/3-mercaptopyruvate sulfurtransferase